MQDHSHHVIAVAVVVSSICYSVFAKFKMKVPPITPSDSKVVALDEHPLDFFSIYQLL